MKSYSSIMTEKNRDKIFAQLEKRLGNKYLKNRLNAEKWHSVFKRLTARVVYREDLDPKYIPLKLLFLLAGSYKKARMNTIRYEVDYQFFSFNNLPEEFDGFKILHLSDIHIEGVPDMGQTLVNAITGLKYDLCVITGDFRFLTFGEYLPAIDKLNTIIEAVDCKYGIIGVLGNHDSINMVPELESLGVRMLINESLKLLKGNDHIRIAGVDNPSFHLCASISKTIRQIPEEDFTILLAHSPSLLREAGKRKIDFYLCGHTHGGQLCLPGGKPIITKAKCERRFAIGAWHYKDMKGYTSRGTGTSGLPIRLYCPPQITIHTLIKQQ